MTIARQPQGIPVGGQFAATSRPEASVSLAAPAYNGWESRDSIRERRDRASEQHTELDELSQAHSVRGAASLLLEKYPNAATLQIMQNEDGENNYDVVDIRDANGAVIKEVTIDGDNDWIYDEAFPNGPYLEELVWDLDLENDSWSEGFATVSEDDHNGKMATIRLKDAATSPLPHSVEDEILTRSLTEDEQEILVRAAQDGVTEMEDILNERAADYEPADLQAVQERLDAVNKVLSYLR